MSKNVLRLSYSSPLLLFIYTFVAEVVLAATSVAGGTGRARGAVFVRRMPPPVSPVQAA